jgi:hypothetical protein
MSGKRIIVSEKALDAFFHCLKLKIKKITPIKTKEAGVKNTSALMPATV